MLRSRAWAWATTPHAHTHTHTHTHTNTLVNTHHCETSRSGGDVAQPRMGMGHTAHSHRAKVDVGRAQSKLAAGLASRTKQAATV